MQGNVPCRAVPCRAVPCRAVPCRAVPSRTGPDRAGCAAQRKLEHGWGPHGYLLQTKDTEGILWTYIRRSYRQLV